MCSDFAIAGLEGNMKEWQKVDHDKVTLQGALAEHTADEIEISDGPFLPSKDCSKASEIVAIDRKTMSPIAEEEMQLELVDDSRETRGSSAVTHCGDEAQSFSESIL